jgi:hypothetical protein
MQKLSKLPRLAILFHDAIELIDKAGSNHPNYEQSTFRDKHYKDVVWSLLYHQKGVCAYTEEFIVEIPFPGFEWKDGYFLKEDKIGLDGTIDHFNSDSSIRKDKGWDYSNLFFVNPTVNREKGTKHVFDFFKPDNPDYDPDLYLYYDFETHRFVPNSDLEDSSLIEQIKHMIQVLGLNLLSIIHKRKMYLKSIKSDILNGLKSFDEIRENELYQFFTSFEMSKDELIN